MAIIEQKYEFGPDGYVVWLSDTTPALETYPSWYTAKNSDEHHNITTGDKYIYQTTWKKVTTA